MCRDQVERCGFERSVGVGVVMATLDRQPAVVGNGSDAIQPSLGNVGRGHPPAPFGEPHCVAALAGTDIERSARRRVADLLDERAVRVAAPQLVCAVAVVPIGVV